MRTPPFTIRVIIEQRVQTMGEQPVCHTAQAISEVDSEQYHDVREHAMYTTRCALAAAGFAQELIDEEVAG